MCNGAPFPARLVTLNSPYQRGPSTPATRSAFRAVVQSGIPANSEGRNHPNPPPTARAVADCTDHV